MIGNVIQPNGSGSDCELLFTKSFAYSDINASTRLATKTLSSNEKAMISACDKVLITLNIGDSTNSTSTLQQWCASDIFDTKNWKINQSIMIINYAHNFADTPLPVSVYARSDTDEVWFKASQAYMDDQWSPSKYWFVNFYKLS